MHHFFIHSSQSFNDHCTILDKREIRSLKKGKNIVYFAKFFPMDDRIAVIDLGTNTFHLLIASLQEDKFEILYKEKTAVTIGKGGINQGYITNEAKERALKALSNFKRHIDQVGVTKIYATATSAIRNAKNGLEFKQEILEKTGVNVRIINGHQEAEYIHLGVSRAVKIGPENSLILDIGGGSNEFIICNSEQVFWKGSFEIGAQRLLDKFHYHDPILAEEINNLELYLDEKLKDLDEAMQKFQPTTLIGSSGTFETLSDIYALEDQIERDVQDTELPLPIQRYLDIHSELIYKNREERMSIPGMIELRVDMIVVASALIHYILKKYDINKMRISTYALKEGLLRSIIENHKNKNKV